MRILVRGKTLFPVTAAAAVFAALFWNKFEKCPRCAGAKKTEVALECLTRASIGQVRARGSVDVIMPACSQQLRQALGEDFGTIDDDLVRVVLATVVAANYADYGASSAINYEDIARADHLNCGNTIFLVGYLFGSVDTEKIRPVGFDGGVVSNHAQLLYIDGDRSLLLDPTIGLVAQVDFNNLMRGIPVPSNKIRLFKIKDASKETRSFRMRVYGAVEQGAYVPSDFMYMHKTLHEQLRKGMLSQYFSPGAMQARTRITERQIP
jgi:hypothetical protein